MKKLLIIIILLFSCTNVENQMKDIIKQGYNPKETYNISRANQFIVRDSLGNVYYIQTSTFIDYDYKRLLFNCNDTYRYNTGDNNDTIH